MSISNVIKRRRAILTGVASHKKAKPKVSIKRIKSKLRDSSRIAPDSDNHSLKNSSFYNRTINRHDRSHRNRPVRYKDSPVNKLTKNGAKKNYHDKKGHEQNKGYDRPKTYARYKEVHAKLNTLKPKKGIAAKYEKFKQSAINR